MNSPDRPLTPIYDQLINEQGDVATAAREHAEKTEREANEVLDFRMPAPPAQPSSAQ
ncbi:hypothetical protein [Streptomyces ochraceiscleroticus]|uniref:Uncharacterized protein n=1 Tax=Streptomyces ochraceiscleroticus TaxID=47761 RepID=A0ABW1MSP9_9ACTN|nr:hypothetical protein [Streptomyces ochraceiscleroticus]